MCAARFDKGIAASLRPPKSALDRADSLRRALGIPQQDYGDEYYLSMIESDPETMIRRLSKELFSATHIARRTGRISRESLVQTLGLMDAFTDWLKHTAPRRAYSFSQVTPFWQEFRQKEAEDAEEARAIAEENE